MSKYVSLSIEVTVECSDKYAKELIDNTFEKVVGQCFRNNSRQFHDIKIVGVDPVEIKND